MTEWTDRPISELCSAIIDCVNKTAPVVHDPTPYKMIRTTNVRNGRVDLTKVRYVDEATYRRWTRRGPPMDGDIVLTREAPLGEVGLLRDAAGVFLGQRLVMYRADPDQIDRDFLLYAMRGPDVQAQIKALGSGATVEHMRVPDCEELVVACPPLGKQKVIGGLLAMFDDLVLVNERRIRLLEDTSRAAYGEWFVRQRQRQPADVMPNAHLPSKRWEVKTLGDIAEVVTDGASPRDLDSHLPYVGLEHFPRRSTTLHDWGVVSTVTSRKLVFARGDTLFGKIRPYFHKVVWAPFAGVASSDAIVFRARPERPLPALVNAIVSSDAFVAEAVATSNGTKMPRANSEVLLRFPLLLPRLDSAIFDEYERMAGRALELASELVAQNQSLAATRDLLLPRLVEGQLDISEVDLGDLCVGRSE